MYQKIRHILKDLETHFEEIPQERKAILERITGYIQAKYDKNEAIQLVFICTHNSRRSHFGQVAAAVAADYYSIDAVKTFSGGTEATAFNPNAIKALRDLGFDIQSDTADTLDKSGQVEGGQNPIWQVHFGQQKSTTCFSKVYDDAANPSQNFAAIMTCSDAEQNCPFIVGTDLRIGTTYKDPKASDGTPEQDATYKERFLQITTEMLYVFSLVK